ncbi:phosphotransferase family protein [Myceligenerans pegani]|uniref:Aminoglycoside phosphotransferase family protein n=1 Tax=Myceligenerans pegani TaxID=2776917 RepID=A0ABR9MVM8_9MICO|nr:aminoglycoside phosphotransferase family protein [Myceligenerans sp. TRM 65318]MBE1875447.1 aminoglycoside phosphotransferase family protein [Myceligenerans sp. TRM 65318]MBE3017718.1 aminoglycoside phosphotransferase family protein [Myceligenerans sp. TRM 65318]
MTRVRPTWPDLPAVVRAAIEERLGAKVTSWVSHDGGYSPGLASVLTTDRGRAFVKTASPDQTEALRLHRREAVKAALLPETVPSPALLWSLEVPDVGPDAPAGERNWAVLAFEPVDGRAVRTDPWDLDDVDLLARLALRIGEHPAPDGDEFPDFAAKPWPQAEQLTDERPAGLSTYDPWLADHLDLIARLATPADRQAEAFKGDSLVHGDFRADNVLIVGSQDRGHGVVVDWPHAMRGAAFLDLVAMLPAVHALGGPEPSEVLDRTPLPRGTDPEAVLTWLAVVTAYFAHGSLQPPPPGIPHLRHFQRIQAEACIAWLRELMRE